MEVEFELTEFVTVDEDDDGRRIDLLSELRNMLRGRLAGAGGGGLPFRPALKPNLKAWINTTAELTTIMSIEVMGFQALTINEWWFLWELLGLGTKIKLCLGFDFVFAVANPKQPLKDDLFPFLLSPWRLLPIPAMDLSAINFESS